MHVEVDLGETVVRLALVLREQLLVAAWLGNIVGAAAFSPDPCTIAERNARLAKCKEFAPVLLPAFGIAHAIDAN